MTKQEIEKASLAHAESTMLKEEFNDPEFRVVVESIQEDFKAGVEWVLKQIKK